MSVSSSPLRHLALIAALAPVAVLTGCAGMVATAPLSISSNAATVSGQLHGGNQPITGATVTIYSAGTTGYGSPSTQFAQTNSANDAFGSFHFSKLASSGSFPTGIHDASTNTYSCPTTGDPLMYIIAKGGQTQGPLSPFNFAAGFIVVLGKCSTISSSTFVDLNEVTTVATLAAMQQYYNPNFESLGSPSTTQALVGIANAAATVPNLVTIANGTANQTFTPSSSLAGVAVTGTPEFTKINTVANILAACVNTTASDSSNCTALFANAVPPASASVTSQPTTTFPAATDVLQAGYYMMVNPSSGSAAHMTALFNLAAAIGAPFQPSAASAPTDWTIGIKYSSTSACTTGNFLAAAYHPAIDAAGNVWIAGASTTGNLMEIGPTGSPLTCTLSAIGAASHSVVLDTAGNVWIAGGTGNANVYKYNSTTSTSTTWPITGAAPIFVLVADGKGNVFYTVGTSLYEFVGAATASAPTAAVLVGTVGSTPNFLAADTTGAIWTTGSTTTGSLFETYPSTGAGNTNGFLTTSTTANYTNGFGLAIGLNNTAYVANSNNTGSSFSNTLSYYTGGVAITASGVTAQYTAGLSGAREAATDGAGNVWSVNSTAAGGNYVTGATTSGLFAVTEFSSTGAAISPTGTSTTTAINGGFQKDLTILPAAGRGIAVDPSGNVWVGLNSAGAGSTSITEIVGAAVPVVTPIPASLVAGVGSSNAVSKP